MTKNWEPWLSEKTGKLANQRQDLRCLRTLLLAALLRSAFTGQRVSRFRSARTHSLLPPICFSTTDLECKLVQFFFLRVILRRAGCRDLWEMESMRRQHIDWSPEAEDHRAGALPSRPEAVRRSQVPSTLAEGEGCGSRSSRCRVDAAAERREPWGLGGGLVGVT